MLPDAARLWAIAVVAALLASIAAAGAVDLRTKSAADIRALQRRLTDARCYAGPIDGLPSLATTAAAEDCPVMDPILRVETGMHTAIINRIGVDRDCRLLATKRSAHWFEGQFVGHNKYLSYTTWISCGIQARSESGMVPTG